jgi:hypothetical protein
MASSSKRRASSSKQSSAGKTRVISVRRKDALPRKGSVSAGPRKPVVQPPIDDPTEPLATAVAGSNKSANSLLRPETTASRAKTTRAAGRASGKLNKPGAIEVMRAAAAVVPGVEVMTPAPAAEKRPAGVVEAPAVIAPAVEPEMVTALEPVAETVGAVEPATTTDEVSSMTPQESPEVEVLAIVETEVEVEASAIVEETKIVEAPFELPVEAATFPSTAIGQLPVFEETRGPPLARTAAESPAPAAPAPHHAKRALITVVSRLLSTLCRWTGIRQ